MLEMDHSNDMSYSNITWHVYRNTTYFGAVVIHIIPPDNAC